MFSRLEQALRQSGRPGDPEIADELAQLLSRRGIDVPINGERPSRRIEVVDERSTPTGREPELSCARLGVEGPPLDIARDQRKWNEFCGQEIPLPHVPDDLIRELTLAWLRIKEVTPNLQFHVIAPLIMRANAPFPGWIHKPEPWFWRSIQAGRIAETAAHLPAAVVGIDTTPRPGYQNGLQLYDPNEPLSSLLQELRERGRIAVPEHVSHVPPISRFGASTQEIDESIIPEIFQRIGLQIPEARMELPSYMLFNILGNMYYSHFGGSNTWEWFADQFGDDSRLISGRSDSGGLSRVSYFWSGVRRDCFGFRPLLFLPLRT